MCLDRDLLEFVNFKGKRKPHRGRMDAESGAAAKQNGWLLTIYIAPLVVVVAGMEGFEDSDRR